MNITIRLPDDQAAALRVQAAAHGLSLEQWLEKLAGQQTLPSASGQTTQDAVARILAVQKRVKPDPEGWTARDYIDRSRS